MNFLQQLASNANFYSTCIVIPGLILGFTFHEYAHAKTAYLLGDDTPVLEGRITLNPVRHIDLLGFVCLILIGFGWAKPVHFNPSKLKKPKRDEGLIGVAGPFTNLILAVIFMILLVILIIIYRSGINMSEGVFTVIYDMLQSACFVNCSLCVFNMIPIPPFDGSHVLLSILPKKVAGFLYGKVFRYIGRYSFIILIILFRVFPSLLRTPVTFIYGALADMADMVLGLIL